MFRFFSVLPTKESNLHKYILKGKLQFNLHGNIEFFGRDFFLLYEAQGDFGEFVQIAVFFIGGNLSGWLIDGVLNINLESV